MTGRRQMEEELAALQETIAALEFRVEELQNRRAEGFAVFESMAHLEALVAERTRELDRSKREVERIVRDRTRELRRKAEELARANERLQELDRVKTNILQNVSHELKTPLVAIHGYAELLLRRLSDVRSSGSPGSPDATQLEYLNIIIRNAKQLNQIIEDLLMAGDAARGVHPLALSRHDLVQITREILEEFAPTAKHLDLQLRSTFEVEELPVIIDAKQIRSAIRNLISNAIKFTTARPVREVDVRLGKLNDDAWIEVQDTGIGIPRDCLHRIFDRLYQVDASPTRRYGGMGIGLALVREAVEGHGGSIFVESEPDVGTRFRILLPSAPARPKEAVPPVVAATPPDILIIEDEEDSAAFFANAVRHLGHIPTCCAGGVEALAAVRPGVTRLMLLDVAMPDMSGFEFLTELRRRHPDTALPPVVLMTARSPEELAESELDPLIKAVIYKPCDLDKLQEALERGLG